ncbi:right-handed parallel beta-helix repeat-containing protein [Actinoplanes friuliensis]|uniref:Right handed beta helix domain-containing protein n=1 Tax=Actinoplanes friuliensis DSM 7358 TaxID=1246995 RepID=U5W0Z2_9ACTN|nr:right-handed parallel beta-helix repeat-containing protein [Actinoplanes friuliensis]AGZ42814.1 hypothetical protein AFR_22720 [Actinoplanes friuliensis DSM 7358]
MTQGSNWPVVRRRLAALPGGPGLWLGGAALLVAVIALVISLTGTAGAEPVAGATGPVGPTVPAGAIVPTAPPSTDGTAPATGPLPTTTVAAGGTTCPAATVSVGDADSLTAALDQAQPGTSILLADGVYEGAFVGDAKGTAAKPIFVCGGPGAVLDGGGIKKGYGFHLDGADHWRLVGFTVRNAQKGVMADSVNHTVISGLTVEQIGDEAIHLRKFSSDNVVEGNTIRDTGKRRDKFGEGVYIGSANSNWAGITGGAPDTSDRNVVRGNTISATTAEAVDIKEGTTGGTVTGNTFDGAALTGADSWVDVKGNNWTISGNTGQRSPEDGFQTHQVYDGWGRGNTFTGNIAQVDGPGYGFHLAPVENNRVACTNKATGAALGLANVDCH